MSTALEIAKGFIRDRGWSPIPIPFKAKCPVLEGWPELRITEKTAQKYFKGEQQNIGVLLGVPSDGLTDIDLDSRTAVLLASYILPKCSEAPTFGRASNPQSHLLYAAKGATTRQYHDPIETAGRNMIVELRATGAQTVFPGSTHESGEAVEWERDGVPPTVSAADLTRSVERLAAATLLVKYGWREGQRDKLVTALTGALLRKDWSIAEADAFVEAIATVGGDPQFKGLGKAAKLERGLRGNRLVQGLPKLAELLPREVMRCVIEWLDLDERLIEPFDERLFIPATNFVHMSIPKRESLIEGLLSTCSIAMIYAARGVGKTMLALEMAKCLAAGRRFLSWTVPQAWPVLYVDGEMSAAELQERVRKFCGDEVPPGLTVLASESFYQSEQMALNLAAADHRARFLASLDALAKAGRRPEVVILDNKSALCSGVDENSNSDQDEFLGFLRQLRHRGYTVILIHHAGKSGDQRGASRNEDFLDLVIKLEVPGANGKDDEVSFGSRGAHFRLSFTKHRGLRPEPASLDVELIEDMDGTFDWAIKKVRGKNNRLRVLEYLFDHAATTQAQIADALGIDPSNVSGVVRQLRKDSKLKDGTLELTAPARSYVLAARANRAAKEGPAP